MDKTTSTVQLLMARFNGQILIPFVDAVTSAGFQEQTARNMIYKGKFPIPTVLSGSRRFVYIQDLAKFIDGLRDQSKPEVKTRRGRPTKASKMAGQGLTGAGDNYAK